MGLYMVNRNVMFLLTYGQEATLHVESAKIVSQALSEHWIWSNVYPKKLQNVQNQIDKLFKEFKKQGTGYQYL